MEVGAQILVIVLLTAVGGFFAGSEIALVSLREGQVNALREKGRRGARVVKLLSDPTRYLATIQIGVTLAGFLSAAFGASALSVPVGKWLEGFGISATAANAIAFVGITLIITYVSLVFAELVPKRLAQQRAEGVALAVAGVLDRLATVLRPFIAFLAASTNLVVRVVGGGSATEGQMSNAELRALLLTEGVLGADERRLIDEVFGAGELQVREVMRPRTEVTFLRASMPVRRALPAMVSAGYSRCPVIDRDVDDVVGFLHSRDAAAAMLRREPGRAIGELAREVLRIPGTKPVLAALAEMRQRGAHLAIVVDEYGGTAGIVTLEDLIEEVVGDIRDEYDVEADSSRQLEGGDLDVDGLMNLEDFAERSGVSLREGPYETVAGFVTASLGRLAREGDLVEADGVRLEVTRMDERRIERVRVHRLTESESPTAESPHAPLES